MMVFSYGQGFYIEGSKKFEGQIILGEHKLYLKDSSGDIASTYIPLDKIERIRLTKFVLELSICPSVSFQYKVHLKGEKKHIADLAKDIAKRRGMKKSFLRNEWIESTY